MTDWIHQYYSYWFLFVLLVIGLYGMLMKRNLVKKLIGMTILQNAIILVFIVSAYKTGATIPIAEGHAGSVPDPDHYMNPLPHTLMLTAIVVGVATIGVGFALVTRIYRTYGTLDESELLRRMQ